MSRFDRYRAAYERDGTVHVPAAFDDRWVSLLRDAFDRLILTVDGSGPPPRARAETANDAAIQPITGFRERASGRAHLRNAASHDPAIWSWVTESPAGELVGTLTGSTRLQFWYDLWFCKDPCDAPAEGATAWHHDATGQPFTGSAMPSLWIALGDVGIDDAPLISFRGSHRDPILYRPPLSPTEGEVPLPPGYRPVETMRAAIAAEPGRVQTWLCKAGDALLIHPQTWHASLPQLGQTRRLACTSRWLGDDLCYDPGPFAFAGFHTGVRGLDRGTRPPVDFLPVVWRRAG